MGFPVRIVGGTDPDRSRAGGFAAVMFAADGAGDQAAKQGDFPWFSGCIFLLLLYICPLIYGNQP